ncbi:hypothetical protein BGX28_001851 [Mortierella sp. GBA30]|nr:hypothetical protein BGX28_001851 [Mortierella sp. GBA30]
MSDKELLAQIAQVAGAINKHLNGSSAPRYPYSSPPSFRGGYNSYNVRGRGRGRGGAMHSAGTFNRKLTLNNNNINTNSTIPKPTVSSTPPPAVRPTSLAKLPARPPMPSRHLSLVNRSSGGVIDTASPSSTTSIASSQATTPCSSGSTSPTSGQQWIQSKGKNMSLMNAVTFKKTMDAKEKSIRSSKEAKRKLREARAKQAMNLRKGLVTVGGQEYRKSRDGRKLVMQDSTKENIVINGVSFEMDPRGNKLVRKGTSKTGESSTPATFGVVKSLSSLGKASTVPGATPKQFSVDGVVYVRTTNGNLVRATLVKDKLLAKRAAQQALKQKRDKAAPKRSFCKFFTRFGQCSRAPQCPFIHSRTHLAICKKFLRGICPNTSSTCKLSHTPSANTTPACSHFQRNGCTKDNCLYPHIRINPQAQICRPFATEGWCDAGINCKDRHVWICPDFGTMAGCKKRCGLAHLANGGIRAKKSEDEIEKDKQNGDYVNSNKRKRMDATFVTRFIDGQRQHDQNQDQDQDQEQKNVAGSKGVNGQYDENFIPLDLGDDFDEQNAMLLEQQEESYDESEILQGEDEDDVGDVSSDGVESDEDEDEDDEEDEYDGDEVSAADAASEEDLELDYEDAGLDDDEYYQDQYEDADDDREGY